MFRRVLFRSPYKRIELAIDACARAHVPLMIVGDGPERPALGRLAYGAALPAFAVLHVIYRDYVASVIPGWIPGHMFWAYATGAAHLAAGIALVTDMRARLAAILAGFMFGSWVVILHLPRAIGAGRGEWTSLIVALAMTGGAWSIARYGMGDGSNNG